MSEGEEEKKKHRSDRRGVEGGAQHAQVKRRMMSGEKKVLRLNVKTLADLCLKVIVRYES